MPSKIQHDENLWFLYICLQKSDLKTIDFTAVGAITNLKPPAARMRYTRLRRQIESGALNGGQGSTFGAIERPKKRKRGSAVRKTSGEAVENRRGKEGKCDASGGRMEEAVVVKKECIEFESSDTEEEEEDKVTLAELRKAKIAASQSAGLEAPRAGVAGHDSTVTRQQFSALLGYHPSFADVNWRTGDEMPMHRNGNPMYWRLGHSV